MIKSVVGVVPGPIATLSYRKNYFGLPMSKWLERSMRQMEEWSFGEAELFSAWVSKLNQRPFYCYPHAELAKITLPDSYVDDLLERPNQINHKKMRNIFAFLKKLTLEPENLTVEDIYQLRSEKISNKAIEELIHICSVFCVMNRLDAAFKFAPIPKLDKIAKFLLYNGYKRAVV